MQRVIVVNKEYFKFFGQKQRSFLKNNVDRLQSNIADLVLSTNHGDQRCAYFGIVGSYSLSTGEIVHISNDQSNGCQHHCRVGVE